MEALALVSPIILTVIFLAMMSHFAYLAWRREGKSAIADRWAVLTRLAAAVATCAIATLLINWAIIPGIVWLAGIALLALGVAGVALRWSGLAWFAADSRRPRRIFGVAADLLISALFIGVALA